jgi:hypothetical protein
MARFSNPHRIIFEVLSVAGLDLPKSVRLKGMLLLVVLVAASVFAASEDCKSPKPIPREPGLPRNIDDLKHSLRYYVCSGSYDRDFKRVAGQATTYVEHRAVRGTKLALVLDIDETSLSNWPQIAANDFGHITGGACGGLPAGPCADEAWEKMAAAKALDPTLRLFKAAQSKNVSIFFITGRKCEDTRKKGVCDPDDALLAATEANLRKAGYSGWAGLALKPKSDSSPVQQFKTATRKQITEQGYTIIADVGDQYSDLNGGYSERVFKLPNPFYFIP